MPKPFFKLKRCSPNFKRLLSLGFLLLLIASCSENKKEKKIRIGFSQCTGNKKWRKATLDGVQKELTFHPGAEVIYRNAEDNSELQIKQIKELLTQDIDILLVSPNEAGPLTPIIDDVYNSGIPVVVIDRKTTSNLYTSFVGVDNYEIGKMAGNYIASMTSKPAQVVEVMGLEGSTPTRDRHLGFIDGIKINPNIHVKLSLNGDWLKEKTSALLLKAKDKLANGDIIFAQNDPMALGASEVYQQLGLKGTVFIGVDGLAGPGGGIELVANHIFKATLLNPTGGEEATRIALKILNREFYNKENILPSVVIDSANVRIMALQNEKINGQQKDIETQQSVLHQMQRIYSNQRTLLYFVIGALLLIFVLGCVASYSLWNNRKKNKRLAAQNREIIEQKRLLEEMTIKRQEAINAKVNFFTNISHELRTPLTLILGPLQDSLSSPRLHHSIRQNLELINKNSLRLLRLINQLMDFRKIEEGKMKVHASENELAGFVMEVADNFRELAAKKSISFNVINRSGNLKIWFDTNMLEKVLFNLISNAFKFCNEIGGIISIIVDKNEEEKYASVRIEDTGIGMTAAETEHAFELFYQGQWTASAGTGIGLSLTRELIELHHGSIKVISEKWKGATFEFRLPFGSGHFSNDEITNEPIKTSSKDHLYAHFTKELDFAGDAELPIIPQDKKEFSLLIIEDNTDLLDFLSRRLGSLYEIHQCSNGRAGLNMAFDIVPDLIVCDIILPDQNGLHITGTLKQDIRTSHIPIVLLTAKGSIEEQIEGLKLQADAYIAKPFNLNYLEEAIKSLIKNRLLLREHYTADLPVDSRSNASSKIDRKFINDFKAIVENRLSDENFVVEDICKEIGISRIQLYKKVKALLGVNVNDYIIATRLQRAKFMLLNEDWSMSEIAFKVGFSSQAYFSTVFKSKFQATPSEFKESRKIRK